MKTQLKLLYHFLKSHKLSEAKDLIILIKTAGPLDDIVSLPKSYDFKHKLTEDDDEDPDAEPEIEEGEITRNELLSHRHSADEWYGSLSFLGSHVILIPFDANEIESDGDLLNSLALIWGKQVRSYEELRDKVATMSGGYNYTGDLSILIHRFPKLWSEIERTLADKGLKADQVTYILYNEDTVNRRGFEKSPRYFTHDLGHYTFDLNEDYDFKYYLEHFINEIIQLYVDKQALNKVEEYQDSVMPGQLELYDNNDVLIQTFKDEHNLYNYIIQKNRDDRRIDPDEEYIEQDEAARLLANFFDSYSDQDDVQGDVFSELLRTGTLEFLQPDQIYYKDRMFIFDDSRESDRDQIEKDLLESLGKYLKEPLSQDAGTVLLYDI